MYIGTDKEKRCLSVLPIFGKAMTILLLIFLQFLNGQITTYGSALIYKSSEIVVDQETTVSPLTIAIIYTSSQTQICDPQLIVGDHEIIVEIDLKKEKKNLKSAVIKKAHEVKIVKTRKVLPRKVNIGDAPEFNSIESSTSLAFRKSSFEQIVSAFSFQVKHFLNREFVTACNRFVFNQLHSVVMHDTGFFRKIHSLSFQVRPPPVSA